MSQTAEKNRHWPGLGYRLVKMRSTPAEVRHQLIFPRCPNHLPDARESHVVPLWPKAFRQKTKVRPLTATHGKAVVIGRETGKIPALRDRQAFRDRRSGDYGCCHSCRTRELERQRTSRRFPEGSPEPEYLDFPGSTGAEMVGCSCP